MLNPTDVMISTFVDCLQTGYRRNYGSLNPDYAEIIGWAGNMALETIANSDALYHNVEHTILVTLVGQEILRGKHHQEGGISCWDWLHTIISLLFHDIGFVRGICQDDSRSTCSYATGHQNEVIILSDELTDASLNPYHVDRGKLFIEERFNGHYLIDIGVIQQNIEMTRFPIPHDPAYEITTDYPGLVRAADLVGQLSDPRYLQKLSALFYEFEEVGANERFGYKSPGDLRRSYPKFYWGVVDRYIHPAIEYLGLTQEGKQIIANLYANVFQVELEQRVA